MADGTPVQCPGKTEFPASIKGSNFTITAYVVKDLDQDLIIGCDFLKRYGAIIDFRKNKLALHKNVQIHALHTITVPPFSEIIMQG